MTSAISRPARVGLITDQTGALSFMGIANVNVAKMVIDDINARGGLLGRPVELYVEDSATDDDIAQTAAARLVREADVDVVVGGIYSSTRQAIKRPVVDEAAKLYIYPEQYEGQESHPLIFCTGPVTSYAFQITTCAYGMPRSPVMWCDGPPQARASGHSRPACLSVTIWPVPAGRRDDMVVAAMSLKDESVINT